MNTTQFSAYNHVYRQNKESHIRTWLMILLGALIIILFLPWTQNIRARGNVTAWSQEDRPQEINSIIGGRIVKWYIREGDFVQRGDTLAQLAEVKVDYLDPNLVARTKEQLDAKEMTVNYYTNKVQTAQSQIGALQQALEIKISQLENKTRQQRIKVQSDSMEMVAANNDFSIATKQFARQRTMFDSGLVSLTQFEQRNQTYQNAMAKKISAENKFVNSKQELGILALELNGTRQEYTEKISKAEGDRFQSLSQIATGQGDIAKLQNQYASYSIRNGMYYIIAPQSGQVIKASKSGIGEIVKEGEMLVHVVPTDIQYAVEMYVRPVDLPLVNVGQAVRFMFDGFPAIVFSGWPQASYGLFSGRVVAVESDVSTNGKFKVLVTEMPGERAWPKELKMGTGASGIALLKNVPVWYELWRNINSFPPDYYKPEAPAAKDGKEDKAVVKAK
ncbi:Multidrug resistance efflux pump [Cnuella takakiae]|uniref:Multidrug resistance efflux pump n=1 Tax=Cnuella takakiae TaxID=1302690 RepID=A0A1M5DMS8_9BACT|nr:HlyD family efflux transporter periplasmic adaptor subunit [Cnuella takakiae]OLY94984.1 biotin attachment protein [Cnuella takakiae]SHF68191.1 Multidrug resistance efflux pump [Cnuella takakiae]